MKEPLGNPGSFTRIIKPLRLRSTSFPTGRWITGRHSHGYVFTPQRLDVTTVSASPTWAAGNMVSTLDDVAVFYRALLRGKLLAPNLLQAMKTTIPALSATRGLGKPAAYGLGLVRFQSPCGRIAWGHEGQTAGYLAFAYASPNGSRQTVVLVNTDNLNGRGRSALRSAIRTAWCG
jgi:D-alanyl-D-alanine carboxypeptidase